MSSGYATDLIIDSLADVWVTFVTQGAGYRNALGFYTYDINNPPITAPTASQIAIIFPYVLVAARGGSLEPANKVIIFDFEDIRRGYSSFDNDFKDVIFDVTANPYATIHTTSIADVSSANTITSTNNGGLESDSYVATFITKRNLNRLKNNCFQDKKQNQTPF